MRLKLYTHVASESGLSAVSTLIVGTKGAVIIDPPLLLQDAQSLISFVRSKTPNPISAVFTSHHHPDHYFTASLILEAYPAAQFFAAPYVTRAIDQEYDDQVAFWQEKAGFNKVQSRPLKPSSYEYSFFTLPDDMTSPIILMGPVQGNCADHTIFWLPTERTIVAGDVVFARSTHVSVEEIDSSTSLAGWRLTLDLIDSLDPVTIVAGHVDKGMQFDAQRDMEHMYRYLDLFEDKIILPAEEGKPPLSAQELFSTFKEAFPACQKNLNFTLGRMADKFGAERQSLQYNPSRHATRKSKQDLEGFVLSAGRLI